MIKIGQSVIDEGSRPYVIAEMSANHNGKIENAFEIIRQAKLAGADAVKIQTYRPDTITLDSSLPDFQITEGLWSGKTLYELYEWAHTPWGWHKELFNKAKEYDITLFSSPFDNTAVDLLEDLGAPAYKIASFEAVDHQLIEYAASTSKPLIISTGMANETEIEEAIDVAKQAGCTQLAILHCVSGYPAPAADYNLSTILDMRNRYGVLTGLSDHTLSNTTALASVALGAKIIEKHFTLDRNGGGPDDSFSITPSQLVELVQGCREVWSAVGKPSYHQKDSEKDNIKFRRSLYFVKDASAGTIVNEQHIRSVRPGYGIAPKFYKELVGKRLVKDVSRGTRVAWDAFED
ncbi:pseudaminic acid synthase [Arenicella xantha]|uniref:N-acetylneuraminate synthase n=1 Tax=Arenicella xantha TaxID=644221 RepID=A0A395JJG0_9GAMM|nr:pseudaminic acid synthase [Arenicella xantha]RBP49889.1 N-acetylneuraminate synthase [Arenicella xantha]